MSATLMSTTLVDLGNDRTVRVASLELGSKRFARMRDGRGLSVDMDAAALAALIAALTTTLSDITEEEAV